MNALATRQHSYNEWQRRQWFVGYTSPTYRAISPTFAVERVNWQLCTDVLPGRARTYRVQTDHYYTRTFDSREDAMTAIDGLLWAGQPYAQIDWFADGLWTVETWKAVQS